MDGAAPADFRHHRPVGSAERCPLAEHHGPASARRWGVFQAGRVCVVCPRYGIEHMFDIVDESTDEILSELEALEGEVAAVRARQVLAIRRLFRAGMTVSAAWLAGRLDVSYRTARDLLEAAARTPEQSVAMARFGSGAMSFDRVTAVAYLVGAKQQSRLRDPAILFSRRPTLVSMRQATIHTPDKYTCDYARGDIGSRELPARGA